MEPGLSVAELLGLFLCVGAWVCTLTTTILPQWLTLSTELLQTESYQLGLWETCVVQDLGGIECRPYDSMLGLPGDIRLARILMCVAVATGLLGLLVPIPGLTYVNCCNGRGGERTKRVLRVLGGAFSFLAGVICLVPVSYMAHLTVLKFWDDTVPDIVPRWEFGEALFCGWTAGFLHIVGGIVLASSHFCYEEESDSKAATSLEMQALDNTSQTRVEYV
ncbi:claudin-22-like [Polyodon spathula]|uniref:claudin-22-like n=1 Tax=Polyodon spathula TaxID=7913 RepID=UPI001B7F0004|nr:claudin-22-like [Polyodon spathula]